MSLWWIPPSLRVSNTWESPHHAGISCLSLKKRMVPIFVQIKELVQVAVKTWKREHLETETLLRYLDTKRNYGSVMEYQKAARLALCRSRLHRSIQSYSVSSASYLLFITPVMSESNFRGCFMTNSSRLEMLQCCPKWNWTIKALFNRVLLIWYHLMCYCYLRYKRHAMAL